MPYNPGLYMPMGYQPVQPMYQTPPVQQAPQMMTPPMRQASIIQINAVGEEEQYQLQPNAPQMFMTSDDEHIIIKTLGANGANKVYFDRRPQMPEEAPFDPAMYVRRDEIKKLVADAVAAQRGNAEEE